MFTQNAYMNFLYILYKSSRKLGTHVDDVISQNTPSYSSESTHR